MSQPDIEIYVRDVNLEDITTWLAEVFDTVETGPVHGNCRYFKVYLAEKQIPVQIQKGASGKWNSIWFDSSDTPWDEDKSCGMAFNQRFQQPVRCNASLWQGDESNMDEWLHINQDGSEQLIQWPNE
ncbi:hypothetical protein ACWJJH_09905 [Endozoicomonadaceae bacterium StTr2]